MVSSSINSRISGMSTIIVVITAALFITLMLFITSQMVISTRSTTVGQGRLSTAQYAAESGIGRGIYRLSQIQQALLPNNFNFSPNSTDITSSDLNDSADNFCNGGSSSTASVTPTASNNYITSSVTCLAPQNSDSVSQFNILSKIVNQNGYKSIYLANGMSDADATVKSLELYNSSESQKNLWWENLLTPSQSDIQSLNPKYTLLSKAKNYSITRYYNASSSQPIRYRFKFKSLLSSKGESLEDQGTNSTGVRQISPSTVNDSNGFYWFDIQQVPLGTLNFDSACSAIGFAATGNGPLIYDVPGTENKNALCHTFAGSSMKSATTMPKEEKLNAYVNTADAVNYNSFATQFRGGFYPGEVFNGGVFTNEFLSFSRNAGVTFNGPVGSAGCIRNTLAGTVNSPDLSTCPVQIADAYLRNTGSKAGELQEVFVNSASSRLPTGTAPTNDSLGKLVASWGGNSLKFQSPPIFNAPYHQMFNPIKQITPINGQNVQLNDKIAKLRSDAISGGVYIDKLVRDYLPGIVPPQPTDGYGYDARVSLEATDSFNLSNFAAPDNSKSYNTTTGQYNLNGNYEYINIEVSPTTLNSTNSGYQTALKYPIILRVDNNTSSKYYGWVELFVYKGVGDQPQFGPVSPAISTSICPGDDKSQYLLTGMMKSAISYDSLIDDQPSTSTRLCGFNIVKNRWWLPLNKFNGNIFGDGNLVIRNANPRQGASGGLANPSGDPSQYSPAVATGINLKVGTSKNMYVISDLTLQNRPISPNINATDLNRLSLYANGDVKISAYFENYTANSSCISPNQANQSNLTLDTNIVTPSGRLALCTSMTENNTDGEGTGFIPDMSYLNLTGSVVSKYNMDVGHYFENDVSWHGYRRKMTADPRGSGLDDFNTPFTVSATSSTGLTSMNWRQDKAN